MAKKRRPMRRQGEWRRKLTRTRQFGKPYIPGRFNTRTLAGRKILYYKSPELAEAEEKRLKRLCELHPEDFAQGYIKRRLRYQSIFADCALRLKECRIEVNLDEARINEEPTDSGHVNVYIEGVKLSGMPKWGEADIILAETMRHREEIETYMMKCREINWQGGQKIKLPKYPSDISNALTSALRIY